MRFRDGFIAFWYKHLLKPIYFRMDPEFIHDRMIFFGRLLGRNVVGRWMIKMMFYSGGSRLHQRVGGMTFYSPLGLAAGFDKNIDLCSVLPFLGFGFAEFGSITGKYCEGNPKPRLWRLPKSQGLVVYYGLKNDGAEALSKKMFLERKRSERTKLGRHFVYGVSLAKTNCKDTADRDVGIEDYYKAYELMRDAADYITINISCPNAFGGQPFTDAESLELLMTRLDKLYVEGKPVFVKLSPDLDLETVDVLLDVCDKHKVDGFVCTNLTKKRDNKKILDDEVPELGGLSGKVVHKMSDVLIAHLYKRFRGEKIIIGVGGVFSAEDAYAKIKLGANLIQMITGMIYMGPSVISEINLGLESLLKRDGYSHVSEAVGVDVK